MTSSIARAFKSFVPLFDRILVERLAPESVSKGGILIPEKAMGKVVVAKVVAHGEGTKNEKGELTQLAVKTGDKVLLPEYGGTKVVLEEQEYHLFREADILGKFEH